MMMLLLFDAIDKSLVRLSLIPGDAHNLKMQKPSWTQGRQGATAARFARQR
jgi:hypothetical protein